jgi:hypothetical protein
MWSRIGCCWAVALAVTALSGASGCRRHGDCASGGRLHCGESAAVADHSGEVGIELLLHMLVRAQAGFREGGFVDGNGDEVGEFGGLRELTGTYRGRVRGEVDLVLLRRLGLLPMPLEYMPSGEARFLGYRLAVGLPGPGGEVVWESARGFDTSGVGAAAADEHWLCYAWPEVGGGITEEGAYFVSERGRVLRRVGSGRILREGWGLGNSAARDGTSIWDGSYAVDEAAHDGAKWVETTGPTDKQGE